MLPAQELLARFDSTGRLEEDRAIELALALGGGCPATLSAEPRTPGRRRRAWLIDGLIGAVAEVGSPRGLTKVLQLAACGIEATSWGRESILERTMARMISRVPCLPPLPHEVAAVRDDLVDFPVLRVHKGVLRAEWPTPNELDDLAYFMVVVAGAGEEVGAAREGASRQRPGPPSVRRAELFASLAEAKAAGRVVDVERRARSYLEALGYPDPVRGAEEDVFLGSTPRYHLVLRDLAESWEALGRSGEAAALQRRLPLPAADVGGERAFHWQDQVKAVIRDEEIAGNCLAAAVERLLDVGGTPFYRADRYGPQRLARAGFDLARLFRGALLTMNRDVDEATLLGAIAAWPPTPRLLAQMRLRDKGREDWERRLEAARGLADTMQAAAIPRLLEAARMARPDGRRRAIAAIGDLTERPRFNPCGGGMAGSVGTSATWVRPVAPLGQACPSELDDAARDRLAREVFALATDGDPETCAAVAKALGQIAAPGTRPLLARLLLRPPGTARSVDGLVHRAVASARQRLDEIDRAWRGRGGPSGRS